MVEIFFVKAFLHNRSAIIQRLSEIIRGGGGGGGGREASVRHCYY
jgi:hypothetical protein